MFIDYKYKTKTYTQSDIKFSYFDLQEATKMSKKKIFFKENIRLNYFNICDCCRSKPFIAFKTPIIS